MPSVLVTGGAGFIGSHLVDGLLQQGHSKVRVLDNLHPQVHVQAYRCPDYLPDEVEFIFADILDKRALEYALRGIDIVFHLVAETGVGQSMYEAGSYARTNVVGTAILWDAIHSVGTVKKLILASSRAVYGEGTYSCPKCGRVRPNFRSQARLADGCWAPLCPVCGHSVQSVATSEQDTPHPTSVYGITKHCQEQLCLTLGQSYGIPVAVLRFFNVYGSRQALSNPYTGILATFLARIRSMASLHIYEDGQQLRDFVHVSDVVQACSLAATDDKAKFQVFNVGSGHPISILQLARSMVKLFEPNGSEREIKVTGHYRVGDIRDCYADIQRHGILRGDFSALFSPKTDRNLYYVIPRIFLYFPMEWISSVFMK